MRISSLVGGGARKRRRRPCCSSERTFEKADQPRNRERAIAVGLALERVPRPRVSGAGKNDSLREKSGLGQGGAERSRLRLGIDDIVVGAVNEQDAHLVVLLGGVAQRRRLEIHPPVLRGRGA